MVDEVGVGPHPEPWPDDARLDPELLAGGARRNVVDRYRYWSREAIVADLDRRPPACHGAGEAVVVVERSRMRRCLFMAV